MLTRAPDLYTLAVQAMTSLPPNDEGLLEDIIDTCYHILPAILKVEFGPDMIQRDKWTSILQENPVFTTRLLRKTIMGSENHRDEIDYLVKEHYKLLASLGRPPLSSLWRLEMHKTQS